MARILGLDPGSRVTGFGVIDSAGSASRYVASGTIQVRGPSLADRLKVIFDGVLELVDSYRPERLAVEKVFVYRNVDSALKLGQARGAAICAAVSRGLRVYEYGPTAVKQAIVGRGHAEKQQIQHMVTVLLGLPGEPGPDAADALAIALTHAHLAAGPPGRQTGGAPWGLA
jgi:crossover junction endodeoxyribonuclease RuvC